MENNQNPTTALALASSSDNIGLIISNTPEAYNVSLRSHDNCLHNCENLLKVIQEQGMNDELDQKAALYISKTKRTVKEMNERRSPVTKLFDQVRKEFTALENDIDPTKNGTVPYQLQQLRNQYAAKKREEEDARRRAEEARRQKEEARGRYRDSCREDYKSQLNSLVISHINRLTQLQSSVTLENYEAVYDTVQSCPEELVPDWRPQSLAMIPICLSPAESDDIRKEVFAELRPAMEETFRNDVGRRRQDLLDTLPSKRTELERASKASAEEAERIKVEMARREADEARRKEEERLAREQEEARKLEAEKAGKEAENLFSVAQASASSYQPKTKVTKKIRVLNHDGFLQVFMMWWTKTGSSMSLDELAVVFKKQIALCEKLANSGSESEFIKHTGILYEDEVKAK